MRGFSAKQPKTLKTWSFSVDEQGLADAIRGSSVVRSALVEVFVEELARDAELRRAIVH